MSTSNVHFLRRRAVEQREWNNQQNAGFFDGYRRLYADTGVPQACTACGQMYFPFYASTLCQLCSDPYLDPLSLF